jgi:hypothetical protein
MFLTEKKFKQGVNLNQIACADCVNAEVPKEIGMESFNDVKAKV